MPPGRRIEDDAADVRRCSPRSASSGGSSLFWFLGKALEEPLGVVLDWIQRYQWWIVGAFIVLTFGQSFRKASRAAAAARKGPEGDDRPSDLDR